MWCVRMPSVAPRLLAISSLVVLLSLDGCHEGDYYVVGKHSFSVEAARRIKPGATAASVRAALGSPCEMASLPDGTQTWVYAMELEKRSWVDLGVRVHVSRARLTVREIVLLRRDVVLSSDLQFNGPR